MPNLAQILTSKSSDEYRHIFEACRDIAAASDSINGVYVVGGVVRDLVIGRAPGDIDISVEGDAALLAKELSQSLGAPSPTESQFLTFKISTAGAQHTVGSIDIVTARSEEYPEPASLPVITSGSIDDDLLRRDFTVNSMAISLSQQDYGNLVDPSNGFADIMRKRIKVHHDESFRDDPTRILRTVRYVSRLGFSIDSGTRSQLEVGLGVLDLLSSDRLRNEFELILKEPTLPHILEISEELGILGAISPGLRVSSQNIESLSEYLSTVETEADLLDLLSIVTFGLNEDEAAQVVNRLSPDSEWRSVIGGHAELAKHVTLLDQEDLLTSEIEELLRNVPIPVISAYRKIGPPLPRQQRLQEYVDRIRFIEPEINGDDLIEIGIPQGPIIGEILDVVKRAKLDEKVATKSEELELAKSRFPGFLTN